MMVAPVTFDMVDHLRVPRTDYPVFGLRDVESLSASAGNAAVVALLVEGSARFVPDTGRARGVTVTATTPGAVQLMKQPLVAGRFFTDAEGRDSARVAVIAAPIVDLVARGSQPSNVLGKSIRLEGSDFRIIGVAPDMSRQGFLAAYIPATVSSVGLAPSLSPRAPSIYVRASDIVNVPSVKKTVESWLTRTHGSWKGRATVSGGEGMRLDQARQAILIFKIVMGAFAGISLVVGGIGIMNVLLAAVTERTREIGIRKATGARNRDILVQFLAESVAITGVGAVLGVVLGLSTAFGVSAIMRLYTKAQLHAAFTWQTLLVAAFTCVATGLAFGTYPALRASRLSPSEAIRHE